MSKPFKIAIPQACHENWNSMQPDDNGRFCDSCQKSVFDFTNASDKEIANKIANSTNLCGRFRKSQLDRQLLVPKEKSLGWIAAASGILAVFGSNSVDAQTTPQVPPPTVQTSDNDPRIMGKVLPPENRLHTVSGFVSDATGPIPGVIVIVQGTDRRAETDVDGKFEIKAKQGDVLVASYIGMIDTSYVITDHVNGISIILVESDELNELVVTGGIHAHRTFFGRLFHSIGNWFR